MRKTKKSMTLYWILVEYMPQLNQHTINILVYLFSTA